MDLITKNSGLQHIVEEIFLNLNYEKLELCQEVNDFWKERLNSCNAMFWLKKCVQKGLSAKQYSEWLTLIKQPKRQYVEDQVTSCLLKMYFTGPQITPLSVIQIAFLFHMNEIIEIMAPLAENPNAPFPLTGLGRYGGYTVIQKAVEFRDLEVIQQFVSYF